MKKVLLLIAFSVLLLFPVGAQNAFADTFTFSDDAVGGDCLTFLGASWNDQLNTCTVTTIFPQDGDIFVIDSGVTLVLQGGTNPLEGRIICTACSFTIINNGKVEINGGTASTTGLISPTSETITIVNNGLFQLNGGAGTASGGISVGGGNLVLDNKGNFELNGGPVASSGTIRVQGGSITITNDACATIEFNGNDGDFSGGIVDFASSIISVTNYGTLIQNPGSGTGSGVITSLGSTVATIIDDPMICQAIGGELIPIETTSLILAGAQSFSWMIPVTLSILGIGLFIITRKYEN